MKLLGLALLTFVLALHTAVIAQEVSHASLIGTWVKAEPDSTKSYYDPSTKTTKMKKDYPGGKVDGMIPWDHVLVLRSDSTGDMFLAPSDGTGELVAGMGKGMVWRLSGADIILPAAQQSKSPPKPWRVTSQGKQLTIKMDDVYFEKYADTPVPYGAFKRSAE